MAVLTSSYDSGKNVPNAKQLMQTGNELHRANELVKSRARSRNSIEHNVMRSSMTSGYGPKNPQLQSQLLVKEDEVSSEVIIEPL